MDGLLLLTAWLAGSIVGKLADPFAWALMGLVAAAGWIRWPWWAFLVAAALATALSVAISYSWWVEAGIAQAWLRYSATILAVNVLLAGLSYSFGRLVARIKPPVA